MKTKIIDIREKIAIRAYFAWLNGSTAGAEADWLAAEAIEIAYAERRAASAAKAAVTRRANAILKSPPGSESALLGLTGKAAARRATAH